MPGVLYRSEREVLEFIAQFQNSRGYSPTLTEIAQATGKSSNSTIHNVIAKLVMKGYVQKVDGNSRVLKIIDQDIVKNLGAHVPPSVVLPLMGYIAAGRPLEPYTDPNATFLVSAAMLTSTRAAYALQVKGSSLIEDGVIDGDYVIIERDQEVKNGDIVVAIVDDNLATLKKYYKEPSGEVILRPANSSMMPIYPKHLLIQGKVVAMIRKFT